jgi:hypothetical protein
MPELEHLNPRLSEASNQPDKKHRKIDSQIIAWRFDPPFFYILSPVATTLETRLTASAVSAREAIVTRGGSNEQSNFERLRILEVIKQLGIDPKAGFSSTEAHRRVGQYEPNETQMKRLTAPASR